VQSRLARLPDKIEDEVTESVREDMGLIKADAIDNINVGGPSERIAWRGPLSASLKVSDHTNESGFRTFVFETDPLIAPYAPVVEFGSGGKSDAKNPDYRFEAPDESEEFLSEITEWVRGKGITPDHPRISQEELPGAIMASIADRGHEPHPFFRPAWRRRELRLMKNIENAVDRAVNDV
jgi:hypothetical protein